MYDVGGGQNSEQNLADEDTETITDRQKYDKGRCNNSKVTIKQHLFQFYCNKCPRVEIFGRGYFCQNQIFFVLILELHAGLLGQDNKPSHCSSLCNKTNTCNLVMQHYRFAVCISITDINKNFAETQFFGRIQELMRSHGNEVVLLHFTFILLCSLKNSQFHNT